MRPRADWHIDGKNKVYAPLVQELSSEKESKENTPLDYDVICVVDTQEVTDQYGVNKVIMSNFEQNSTWYKIDNLISAGCSKEYPQKKMFSDLKPGNINEATLCHTKKALCQVDEKNEQQSDYLLVEYSYGESQRDCKFWYWLHLGVHVS